MAAESTKYYVGFDESVGTVNASNLLYRNIFVQGERRMSDASFLFYAWQARKEELEKKANERFKENALYGRPISGGIVDAIYNGYKESKDESKQSKGTESSSSDKTVKRFVIAFFAIAMVVLVIFIIKDPPRRLYFHIVEDKVLLYSS